jgi:hypothetical protein
VCWRSAVLTGEKRMSVTAPLIELYVNAKGNGGSSSAQDGMSHVDDAVVSSLGRRVVSLNRSCH